MNSAIVRFISAFIPSAPARRAFRNRHNLARLAAAGENAISIDPSDYGRIRLRVIGSGNVIKIGKMRPGRGVLDVLLCGDGCDVSIGDGLRIARCLKVTLGQMEKGYGKIRHAALQIGRDVGVEEAQIITYNGNSAIRIGDETYTLPGEPNKVAEYAELVEKSSQDVYIPTSREFKRGDQLADGFVVTGDHLFVERCSLYLNPPRRGDVMVFNTENLFVVDIEGNSVPLSERSGYYYIKRIVGLPGDTLKIEGGCLYIKPEGKNEFIRADRLDPRFKKIFSGKGGYQGYTNDPRARFLRAMWPT